MSVSKRTKQLTGIALAGLLSTVYLTSSTILLRSVDQAEVQSAHQSTQRVLNVLEQTQNAFSTRFADWSSWDDAYTFVEDGNSKFIQSNLVPESLANLKVNLVIFVQPSGKVVFGTGFDHQAKQNLPLPSEFLQQLSVKDLLLQQPLQGKNLTGLMSFSEGTMIITSRPILTSEGKGPIHGILIFGRYLDSDEVKRVSKITRLPLMAQKPSLIDLPQDFQKIRPLLTSQNFVVHQALNEQVMGGYMMLNDIYNQPALLLRADIPRDIHQQGQSHLRYLTVSLFVISLIGGGIIFWLVKQLMESLLKGQQTEIALQQTEEKYRSIFENAVLGIFQTTPEGRYLNVNPALAQIYGYESPEELMLVVNDIEHKLYVEHDRRKKFVALLEEQETLTNFESQIYCKDGSIIWISETARVVRDVNHQVLYYEGFVSNTTKIKQIEIALQESEERYALIIQGSKDGFWDWNLHSNQIFFSTRWKSMLGYEEGEIGNKPEDWFNRIHPDDAFRVHQEITACIEGNPTQFESEYRIQHKDGHYLWMLSQGWVVRNSNGKIYRILGSQTEITERKQAEEQLIHDALHDSLTGLPNRVLFMDRLGHAVQLSKRYDKYYFAVLFIDLDRFKVINDSLGHLVGDQLLIEIAQRLSHCLRECDTFARLGGDEFVILLDDIQDAQHATLIAERIQTALKTPFELMGHEVFASASIGIILGTTQYDRAEDLLRDADTAMYRAKGLGRSRYQIFDPSMHEHAMTILRLENDMRRAISNQEFHLHYQPIVSLRTNRILGFEALLRWQHPTRGLIAPSEFIAIAEETGLIIPLGWWVLREACRQMKEWQLQFPSNPPLSISVNVSSKQFAQSNLVEEIEKVLQETGLSAQSLKLEITESTVMENADAATVMLQRLRDLDIHLSIDDFGTGYSSLGYLHRFPVDTLKIDRSFVDGVENDLEKMEIIRTVVTLAWNLGMDIVAEGVETKKQLAQLKALHCENGQGYLFSKPMSNTAVIRLLQEQNPTLEGFLDT